MGQDKHQSLHIKWGTIVLWLNWDQHNQYEELRISSSVSIL